MMQADDRRPLEVSERVMAKFAHLREQQRQTEAEERARAEVANIHS